MKSDRNFSLPEETRAFFGRFCPSILLISLIILTVSGCGPPVVDQKTDLAPPSAGAELFRSKCGKCHDLERALTQYRSAEVWFDTINRMKEEHKADISREEVEKLVKYHVQRQQEEAAIFREKCEQCHPGKVFLEKRLSEDQARAIIKRMQQKAGNNIQNRDVEIIVRYHVRAQQAALQKSLRGIGEKILPGREGMKRGMMLFVEKCSACHQPTRAFSVIKDPEVWAQTIKRMQSYSEGAITDAEAREIVDFHVTRQQREINTFKETCTKCHDDKRINSRSMTEEQWLATIKRMQQKAPELISDEKVNLLAAYFHRRELTMARIFNGKCRLCHFDSKGKVLPAVSAAPVNSLIALANEEFGRSLQLTDINSLVSTHTERQQRNMQLYEKNCNKCHVEEPSGEKGRDGLESPGKRTRAEWVSLIAVLQGEELNRDIQKSINSQIDFHISRQ